MSNEADSNDFDELVQKLETFRNNPPPVPSEASLLNQQADSSDTNSVEFASYETDTLKQTAEQYTSITYKQMVDAHGRTIYRFDDKDATTPLEIVIFKNLKHTLVAVNQVVLPLESFLSIHAMEFHKNKHASELTQQLRSQPVINKGTVKAFIDEESVEFFDITVPLIMMAITVLSEKYRPFAL